MHQAIALLPAFLFLATLLLLDSFKLVRPATVGAAVLYGAVAASGCAALHEWLLGHLSISLPAFTRYVSPLTEEAAKILFIAFLFWRRRVGFLVDAAVLGFAVGTGFAIVENMLYLRDLGQAPLLLWVARGLGTAVLHGATTAIAAMLAKMVTERQRRWPAALAIVPGWAVAVVIHSTYNHLLVSPLVATALLLIVLPLIVMAVFERSENATREWVGAGLDLDLELLDLVLSEHFQATRLGTYLREWVGAGLDLDLELLDLVLSEHFQATRLGQYLRELRSRFEGPVVADMFCLLRLELELSVQAKARIMARNAGLEMPVDDDLHEALAEREFLRRSIGPTGLLALKPLQVTSDRDDWHRYLLSQADVRARIKGRLKNPRKK